MWLLFCVVVVFSFSLPSSRVCASISFDPSYFLDHQEILRHYLPSSSGFDQTCNVAWENDNGIESWVGRILQKGEPKPLPIINRQRLKEIYQLQHPKNCLTTPLLLWPFRNESFAREIGWLQAALATAFLLRRTVVPVGGWIYSEEGVGLDSYFESFTSCSPKDVGKIELQVPFEPNTIQKQRVLIASNPLLLFKFLNEKSKFLISGQTEEGHSLDQLLLWRSQLIRYIVRPNEFVKLWISSSYKSFVRENELIEDRMVNEKKKIDEKNKVRKVEPPFGIYYLVSDTKEKTPIEKEEKGAVSENYYLEDFGMVEESSPKANEEGFLKIVEKKIQESVESTPKTAILISDDPTVLSTAFATRTRNRIQNTLYFAHPQDFVTIFPIPLQQSRSLSRHPEKVDYIHFYSGQKLRRRPKIEKKMLEGSLVIRDLIFLSHCKKGLAGMKSSVEIQLGYQLGFSPSKKNRALFLVDENGFLVEENVNWSQWG